MGHHIIACTEKDLRTAFASVHMSAAEGFATGNIYEVLEAVDRRRSCSGDGGYCKYRTDHTAEPWPVQPNVAAELFINQIYTYLQSVGKNQTDQEFYIHFG